MPRNYGLGRTPYFTDISSVNGQGCFYKWGIQLFTVTPSAKDELAQKYPAKLALYCEDWVVRRTLASHFLV
jgi:hypothetical protein